MPQKPFVEAIKVLEQVGFFTYVLPLILVFAIIYGVMESAKILKKEMRALIAFLSALFLWYFASLPTLVTSFGMMFAGTSMLLVVILSILLIIGLILPAFGLTTEDVGKWASRNSAVIVGAIILGFVLGFYLFSQTPGWELIFGKVGEGIGVEVENIIGYAMLIAVIVGTAGAIWWMIKE